MLPFVWDGRNINPNSALLEAKDFHVTVVKESFNVQPFHNHFFHYEFWGESFAKLWAKNHCCQKVHWPLDVVANCSMLLQDFTFALNLVKMLFTHFWNIPNIWIWVTVVALDRTHRQPRDSRLQGWCTGEWDCLPVTWNLPIAAGQISKCYCTIYSGVFVVRFSESQTEVIPILQLLKISVGAITSELFFSSTFLQSTCEGKVLFGKAHPTKNYPLAILLKALGKSWEFSPFPS